MLQISFRPLRRGNVAIDCVARNLFAWYRNRHTDHGNVYTTAVLAPANGFGIHSLPPPHQVPEFPYFLLRLLGCDQAAEALAEGFVRRIAKNPREILVHAWDLGPENDPIVPPVPVIW